MPTRVVSTPHPRRPAWWFAAACAAAIGFFTLLPSPGEPGTAFACLVCGSRGGVDAILNLLLFAPLGFALTLCGVRPARAIVAMALLSASIEAIQFMAIPGRDATLGDIVMDTAGGAIGVAMAHWSSAWLRPSSRFAAWACGGWSALWLAMQALSSFAFAPSLPDAAYYGQIARSFASMATFRGNVLDAHVGATTIPDERMASGSNVRALLATGATVSAVVVPGPATSRLAPIIRIADRHRDEVLILGQDARAIVFGVRTGAAVLRLRPPLFALPDALPGSAPTDTVGSNAQSTVRLDARYGSTVHLAAEQSGIRVARDIQAVAGLGWTLVLPEQWYIEGSAFEAAITALWFAAGLFPLGYWAGWVRARHDVAPPAILLVVITVALAAILACGLTLIPLRSGLSPANSIHWLSAVAGTVAGFAASLSARRRPLPDTM